MTLGTLRLTSHTEARFDSQISRPSGLSGFGASIRRVTSSIRIGDAPTGLLNPAQLRLKRGFVAEALAEDQA